MILRLAAEYPGESARKLRLNRWTEDGDVRRTDQAAIREVCCTR